GVVIWLLDGGAVLEVPHHRAVHHLDRLLDHPRPEELFLAIGRLAEAAQVALLPAARQPPLPALALLHAPDLDPAAHHGVVTGAETGVAPAPHGLAVPE